MKKIDFSILRKEYRSVIQQYKPLYRMTAVLCLSLIALLAAMGIALRISGNESYWLCFVIAAVVLLSFSLFYVVMTNWFVSRRPAPAQKAEEKELSEEYLNTLLPKELRDGGRDELVSLIKSELKRYSKENTLAPPVTVKNMRRLLNGIFPVSPSTMEAAGIQPGCAAYRIAELIIDDYSDMFFDDRNVAENIDVAHVIFRTVLLYTARDKAQVSCCVLGGNIIAVFALTDAADAAATVADIVHETVDLMERNYGLDIRSVMSWLVTEPTELSTVYKTMIDQYRLARSVNNNQDFIASRIPADGTGPMTNNRFMKQLQMITNTMLAQRYETIPSMVETLLNSEVSSISNDYGIVKSRLSSVGGVLAEGVLSFQHPSFDAKIAAKRLQAVDTVADLIRETNEIFLKITQLSLEETNVDTVDMACSYIQHHLDQQSMNIPMVCSAVGVSSQHLSRLFRQRLDMTVSEYINECRIKAAKELLSSTSANISEIASKVGYGSTDSFSRNFLKIEGINPSEYRKLSIKKAANR